MAYRATIFPVMIASPGDVEDERMVIRQAIHDWNDINAATAKVMLAPVGWDTSISPELGGRPQELINEKLLTQCDLLIGVFWTKLGTSTGKAASGTVEEITNHVNSGKPAMVYFSEKPVAPQSIDAAQFEAVQEFKRECYKLGIVSKFESLDDFTRQVNKHLPMMLNTSEYLKIATKELSFTDFQASVSAPRLSDDAIELLVSAVDNKGQILRMAQYGGVIIMVGSKRYGGDERESARWDSAMEELLDNQLLDAKGDKGQVFALTHAGWSEADKIGRSA